MKNITLYIPGGQLIELKVAGASGQITSNLHDKTAGRKYNAAINGLESLVLAQACAGIDVETPEYMEALTTALDAIENSYLG